MADSDDTQFWYNLKTGEVEEGRLSPSVDRAGPYRSREEAAHALESMRANSERWAREEAEDNG